MPVCWMDALKLTRKTTRSADFGILPILFLCTVFSVLIFGVRSADGFISKAEKYPEIRPECMPTGFVEKVNCPKSKKDEYKSCRSIEMEKSIFWKFVGGMMGASVAFALVVLYRQRTLDGRALEKVRKQIESI